MTTSEVNPDQNVQSRDSGIPTKMQNKSRDSRKSEKISRKSGISRYFPEIGIPEANGEFYFA